MLACLRKHNVQRLLASSVLKMSLTTSPLAEALDKSHTGERGCSVDQAFRGYTINVEVILKRFFIAVSVLHVMVLRPSVQGWKTVLVYAVFVVVYELLVSRNQINYLAATLVYGFVKF